MPNKEPMVWESIVNEPARQEKIEEIYEEARRQNELAIAKRLMQVIMRMYEKAAMMALAAMVCFALSSLALDANIVWASWAMGIVGVCVCMAASYLIGKAAGTKRK